MKKKVDITNIADRTQYYSTELKKNEMGNTRVGKYRNLIINTLAVEITMSSVKTSSYF